MRRRQVGQLIADGIDVFDVHGGSLSERAADCRRKTRRRRSGEERFHEAGDVFRPVVMQHVAGRGDDMALDLASRRSAARGTRPWCSGRPTRCRRRCGRPRSRAPARRCASTTRAIRRRWRGSGSSACGSGRPAGARCRAAPFSPGTRFDQWPASQRARSAAQQRVGLVQPRRDRLERVVGAQRLLLLQARPARRRARFGACSGRERGMPKPSRLTRRRTLSGRTPE